LVDEVRIWKRALSQSEVAARMSSEICPLCPSEEPLRSITFANQLWYVKPARWGRTGPGNNYWSEDNVSVDANGRLHLKIVKRGDRWTSAEIWSAHSFGYGNYRFTVDTPVHNLDQNGVLGLFTYAENPESCLLGAVDAASLSLPVTPGTGARFGQYSSLRIDQEIVRICGSAGDVLLVCPGGRGADGTAAVSHAPGARVKSSVAGSCKRHELDIEFSGWGVGAPSAQYVVAPNCGLGVEQKRIFAAPAGPATHSIWWGSGSVNFESFQNSVRIQDFAYSGPSVPQDIGESVHINLWLVDGRPPACSLADPNCTVEVVISAFEAPAPRIAGRIVQKGPHSPGVMFVDLQISNTGTGVANAVSINRLDFRTLSGTGSVTYNTSLSPPLPILLSTLDIGASTTRRLYLNVPSTVTRFSVTESGTLTNAVGTSIGFSTAQSIFP
jgi:hypothetical protein